MKKLIALLTLLALTLSAALSLVACTQTPDEEADQIRIGYFAGTTGIGMAKMIADGNEKYKFTPYAGPAFIQTDFIAGKIDIAALPTNAAPAVYTASEKNAQLLAINTLGVLYICTNGDTVTRISDLADKTIYVPEKAPMKVLKYVLDTAGVTGYTLSESYNLDTLPAALAAGQASIALLPEPKVTVAQNLYKKAQTEAGTNENNFKIALDVSAEWNNVSNDPLVQGCVIINPAFAEKNPALVAAFLADYEASVNYMKNPENLATAAQYTVDAGILPNLAVAKSAIPRSNITFMTGDAMMAAAKGFYSALGMQSPADTFYFKPAD